MTNSPSTPPGAADRPAPTVDLASVHGALFEQLVAGHGHMALMFLGRLENPQTGRHEEPEPLGAKIFIDQLDMLVAKTQGNLSEREAALLQQTLTATQAAFVEVIKAAEAAEAAGN